jgi:hypothetical protein
MLDKTKGNDSAMESTQHTNPFTERTKNYDRSDVQLPLLRHEAF